MVTVPIPSEGALWLAGWLRLALFKIKWPREKYNLLCHLMKLFDNSGKKRESKLFFGIIGSVYGI
jgi:hypothetical protein